MFRWLHNYYTNMLDKPSIIYPLNLWSYTNIKYYKFKYLRNIYIFISNLDTLKIRYINILYRDWTFEKFYSNTINYIIIMFIILYFL